MGYIIKSFGDVKLINYSTGEVVATFQSVNIKVMSWGHYSNQEDVEDTTDYGLDKYGNLKESTGEKISDSAESDWRTDYINYKNGGK